MWDVGWSQVLLVTAGLLHTLLISTAQGIEMTEYGVLVVETREDGQRTENPTNDQLFCVLYYTALYNISDSAMAGWESPVPLASVLDLGQEDSCTGDLQVEGRVGYINGSYTLANCSIAERAQRMQEGKALGLITDRVVRGKYNSSDYNISIPVIALVEKSAKARILKYQTSSPKSYYYVYSTGGEERSFDMSLIVILLMAVGTVILGSLWSGYAKQSLRMKKEQKRKEPRLEEEGTVQAQDGAREEEELSVHVSPILVIFFVLCMCSMLVLLYFFFDQLVYVIMTMFCIASSLAMYSCLEPIVMASYQISWLPVLRLPRVNLYICILQLELRQFFLLLISVGTAATWFIFRKEEWSWIIQDFLGIMFSINMLKVLRLPSLKICTILLSALFFYDIFFVFITPLFMPEGKSVMVEVATGHSSDEQLPMVLRVPHLSTQPSRVCYVHTYSLLGFGDILVPGLLLSYAHSFDLLSGIKYKLYWLITTVAYVLGLVATFISLFLMNSAQPALLYLVPFTLLPTILVSWLRGDLPDMWEGDTKAMGQPRRCATSDNGPEVEGKDVEEEEEGDEEDSENEDEDMAAINTAPMDPSISTPDKNKLLAQK